MPKRNEPRAVVRNVRTMQLPPYAVVRLNPDGTGEDVAWFFNLAEATNYAMRINTDHENQNPIPPRNHQRTVSRG